MATNTATANTANQTTQFVKQPSDPTAGWILAGAAGLSALSSGLRYANSDISNLPGVPAQQKMAANRQDVIAQRLANNQGLTDTQYNRFENTLAEQSGSLVANITAQARDTMMQSPLMFDALVKQAIDKATSTQQAGMEKLGIYDVETVMNNARASITAAQGATQSQVQITEQERAIAEQERQIAAEENAKFMADMQNLSNALRVAFGNMDAETKAEDLDSYITEDQTAEEEYQKSLKEIDGDKAKPKTIEEAGDPSTYEAGLTEYDTTMSNSISDRADIYEAAGMAKMSKEAREQFERELKSNDLQNWWERFYGTSQDFETEKSSYEYLEPTGILKERDWIL
jgi:hypothetical protein